MSYKICQLKTIVLIRTNRMGSLLFMAPGKVTVKKSYAQIYNQLVFGHS